MQGPQIVPSARQDVLVTDAVSGQPRRLTLYGGTAWFSPPPQVSETTILGLRAVSMSGRAQSLSPSQPIQLFVPDSLAYRREALGSAVVSLTAASMGSQDTHTSSESSLLLSAHAAFVDDPQRPGTAWLGLTFALVGRIYAVSYQLSVTVSPDAA